MALSVRQRLIAFSVISIVGMLMVGATGYWGSNKQAIALADMNSKLRALRNHLESDMMHDALRSDVLAALYAGKSGKVDERSTVEADLTDHIATFERNLADTAGLALPAEINNALAEVKPTLKAYIESATEIVTLAFTDFNAAEAKREDFNKAFGALEDSMEALSNLIEKHAEQSQISARDLAQGALHYLALIVVAVSVFSLGCAVWIIRAISTPLRQLHGAIEAVRTNDGTMQRLQGFTADFADIQTAFNGVLDNLETQRAEERRKADGAYRVQQALSVASANIVLADADQKVIYVNDTARELFARHGAALKRDLPNLNAQDLLGASVGTLYKDGASTLTKLANLKTTQHDDVELGNRRFHISATPVLNGEGERLGTVFEWEDRTAEHLAATQIQATLAAAVAGELDTRLDVESMQGFMRTMGEGVNQMLDAIVRPLRVVADNLKQIADGKIPAPIDQEFKGEFAVITDNLNTCSKVLRAMIDDVTQIVESAKQGELNQRADIAQHWGDFRKIVEGLNHTLDAIVAPIKETAEVMSRIAQGDLTRRMDGAYAGDFATLRDAVNSSVTNLLDMVDKIRDAAGSIGTASSEISKGNQDLNHRTTEQASSLEQTSNSLRTLTEAVRQNTQNARQANQLAAAARGEAEEGGRVVSTAVSAMVEINSSSRKIADIIAVIDGIAFQTNLLALNAAVEAARAGEQGRGFAVVAAEVRSLAQRSASAAKEIKDLINDSVSKVDEGTKLVNASGQTLQSIVGAVKRVSDIIAEIAVASEEQSGGIEGLNRAVQAMDESTQQNAALVEEAAAASESMDTQAQALTRLMEFFSAGGASGTPVSARGNAVPKVERRQSSRPWSSGQTKPNTVASATQPATVVGGEQWEEF